MTTQWQETGALRCRVPSSVLPALVLPPASAALGGPAVAGLAARHQVARAAAMDLPMRPVLLHEAERSRVGTPYMNKRHY